ncbi:Uncharacterised protein [Mesomycoplasma neurolyticum]|uniref:Uncharacterized protein n=2 Tax=Mesomycoplasma neurolyticum TaxID=2120 RepID=A0A449A580_9BACT|nr:Uncharacterised protein [Mesomycoplasma neurolyticum]
MNVPPGNDYDLGSVKTIYQLQKNSSNQLIYDLAEGASGSIVLDQDGALVAIFTAIDDQLDDSYLLFNLVNSSDFDYFGFDKNEIENDNSFKNAVKNAVLKDPTNYEIIEL